MAIEIPKEIEDKILEADNGESFLEILKRQDERLHEDLLMYLAPNDKPFPTLKHPLVFAVPYFAELNPKYNDMYKHKVDAIRKHVKNKEWLKIIWLYERPYRLSAFGVIDNYITNEEYWEAVRDIWTDGENIWQYKDRWKMLFKCTALGTHKRLDTRHLFMTEEDRKFFDNMPDEFVVYRGYNPKHKNKNGMSYTLDKEKAEWFAKRLNRGEWKVFEKKVRKSDVFAYTNARGEQEIIIVN